MIKSVKGRSFTGITIQDLFVDNELFWRIGIGEPYFYKGKVQEVSYALNERLKFLVKWDHSNFICDYSQHDLKDFLTEIKFPTEATYGID